MSYTLDRKKVCTGVYFNSIIDPRYKTNRISINLVFPLERHTATSASIVPFILRKGFAECPDFSELNRLLNSLYGASLDADVRKLGDNQVLNVSISGIDNAFTLEQEDIISKTCKILCKTLLTPVLENGLFLQKDLELERQYLVDTIEAEINDKRSYAIGRLEEIMFEGESYGIKTYGYKDEAEKLTKEQATKAYTDILKHSFVEIMFIGCGDSRIAFDIIQSHFKMRNLFTDTKLSTVKIKEVKKVNTVTEKLKIAQSKMVMGFRTDVIPSNDNSATRLAIALYGGTTVSKLFLNVREKLSLCYYCSSRFDKTRSIMLVDCGVEHHNIEKAKDEILLQLESMKSGDFTDEELYNAKLSLINSLKSVADSPSGVEIWYLGQVLFGTSNSPLYDVKLLGKVTKQEVIEASKKLKLDTIYILTA